MSDALLPRAFVCALAALVTLALAGCGFQMRGDVDLPDDVKTVHIVGPTIFRDELETFLESGGAEVVGDPAVADATVSIGKERFAQRVIAVDPNTGKEREFEMVYTVSFNVTRPDGTVPVGPERVRLARDFLFDSDQVLGRSRERDLLRTEMRRDAAEEIVRRIDTRLR